MALKLKRQGITRVRPLQGGLRQWMDAAYPVSQIKPAEAPAVPVSSVGGS